MGFQIECCHLHRWHSRAGSWLYPQPFLHFPAGDCLSKVSILSCWRCPLAAAYIVGLLAYTHSNKGNEYYRGIWEEVREKESSRNRNQTLGSAGSWLQESVAVCPSAPHGMTLVSGPVLSVTSCLWSAFWTVPHLQDRIWLIHILNIRNLRHEMFE